MILATNLPSQCFGMAGKNEQINFTISILFLLMLFGNSLSAQTKTLVRNDSIKFKFDQKYISVSPLISPRICFGLLSANKFEDQRFNETILYVHACESFSVYKVYGIAARINHFFARNKKSGCFWIMNVGLDFLQMEPLCFDPGGSNCDDEGITAGIAPNISTGLGYSFKLKNDSYLRLEWDVGLKWFLSNIYISYVW